MIKFYWAPTLLSACCLLFSSFLLCCFYYFLPHCSSHQTIMKLLNNTWGRKTLTQCCLWFNYHALCTSRQGLDFIETIKKKAINSKINIRFHNYLKKAITAVKESGSEACETTQTHSLLCFWGAACMLWVSAGGRVRFPSGTERNGSESRQLDPQQATMLSSENRSVTERGERKDGGWVKGKDCC